MKELTLIRGEVALVDDDLYQDLRQYTWYCNNGYAVRNKGGKIIRMHRVITNASVGMDVDHKDRNRLNNQRNNLRVCSRSDNTINSIKSKHKTSQFKGVSVKSKRQGKDKYYKAQIRTKDKRVLEKLFPYTPEGERRAAELYDKWAIEYHGEFARLNF